MGGGKLPAFSLTGGCAGAEIDRLAVLCSPEQMGLRRLLIALKSLTAAISEANEAIEEMRREHDPLSTYIFVSRRQYQATVDTKGGRRREVSARLSYGKACDLGYQGSLSDWEKLLAAAGRRT